MLEQNWNKFLEEHEDLCLSGGNILSEKPYLKTRVYERCQAFYVYARAKLLNHREDSETAELNSRSSFLDPETSTAVLPRNALPRVKLPNFSGDYKSWRSFYDLFTRMIRNNKDLSDAEKMHYLKTCVTGEAARLISNLPASSEYFIVAWDMLMTTYENKPFLISAQLDRIYDIKPLKVKSAQGMRSLRTTVLETVGALRALGCAVDQWDPLLVHYLVKLLDPQSREIWEMKFGSLSTYPTFSQFNEFLLGRIRAMENINSATSTLGTSKDNPSNFNEKPRHRSAAHVTSDLSHLKCPLCGAAHYLAKCEQYQSKTTPQRRDIVQRHRRCFNCLGAHAASKCTSTKRCQKCGKKHHTSIHDKERFSKQSDEISDKRTADQSATSSQTQSMTI
ncbi:uncharacterized protein LOC118648109 [Monomorium pharaonis]|uniref:uncharacterized protein LOC118648109 n=1 Tax=Monomorium pharaonis TaxID=307658 RepID=UPI00174742D0|nr:uncharacterized protein LOC118648109 [Monomorium pharaonis]